MTRPQTIIWFERCYLGAMLIGLMNSAVNFSAMQAQIAANPDSAMLPGWFPMAMLGFGVAINLTLWFFVARRGSVVAKWVVVSLFGLGAVGLGFAVMRGTATPNIGVVGVVAWILNLSAVLMLFRADTKPWFSSAHLDDEDLHENAS